MPDKTVTIQINTKADLGNLSDLVENLEKLQGTVKSFGRGGAGFDRFTAGLNNLVHAMERADAVTKNNPLGKINTNLAKLNTTIGGMGKGQKAFANMTNSLTMLAGAASKIEKLKSTNLGSISTDLNALSAATAQFGKGTSSMAKAAAGVTTFVTAAEKLGTLKDVNLSTISSDLTKLGTATATFSKGSGNLQKTATGVTTLVTAAERLSKLTGMGIGKISTDLTKLGTSVGTFGKGVGSMEKSAKSVTTFVTAAERLSKLENMGIGHISADLTTLGASIGTFGKGVGNMDKSARGISSFVSSAEKLSKLTNMGLSHIATQLTGIATASNKFGPQAAGMEHFSKGLSSLVTSTTKLKGLQNFSLKNVATGLTAMGTSAANFSKGIKGFSSFGSALKSITGSMNNLSKANTVTLDTMPEKLEKSAAAMHSFQGASAGFESFSKGVGSLSRSLAGLDALSKIDLKQMNSALRSSALVMDKFNITTDGFETFAKGSAAISRAMLSIKTNGTDAVARLQDFINVVKQLDQALAGVPINLQALAKGIRDSAKAVQSLDNQNRTQNTIKETTKDVQNLYNMWGKLTGRMTKETSVGESFDQDGNKINDLTKVMYKYEQLDKKGNVVGTGMSDESSIRAMQLVNNNWHTLAGNVENVTSRYRAFGAVGQGVMRGFGQLGSMLSSLSGKFNAAIQGILRLANALTKLAGNAITGAVRGLGNFANSASSQFANLRKSMDANGGIFTRFQKHVTDTMAQSQRAIMQFYSSGWSFLVSGRMMSQAGQNIFQNLNSRLTEYTDYEKNLTRTAIAGATPYDANGQEIKNMYNDVGEVNIPVKFDVDRDAVQQLIFGIERGLYGPAVKNFSASDIAEGAYYFSSAVGTPITKESLPDLGPLLTTLTQIADITRTSPETVTKGVINAATEFGIDPRDSANYKKLQDVASDMAYVSNVTTLEFPDIAESFKMVGPMADQLGITIDDAMSYIMELSDYGLRGSQVGRGLSMTLSRLNDPTEKMMSIVQDAYGTGGDKASFRDVFFDEHGKLKGGLQGLLGKIQSGTDEDHAAQFIAELFTENATRTTIAAVAAAMKDPKRFSSLQQLLESDASMNYINAAITANQTTLGSSMQNFRNAFFQITAALVDNIKGPLMGALNGIANMFFKVSDVLKNNPAISKFIAGLTGLIGVVLSVAGALFTAFGSMLLFSKAITMAAGSGFGVVRILKDMFALVRTLTPAFILLATIGSLFAIGWKEDFGGLRSTMENADIGKILNRIATSITRNVKMLGGAYAELIRVLVTGSGTINNLEDMLGRVFGKILGPIALHHIMHLRDAMQGLRDDFASFGKGAGAIDFSKMFGSIGGATQGFFEQIFTGGMQQGNYLDAQTLLRPILGPDWKATWNKAADTARNSLGLIVAYFHELGNLVGPVLGQIADNMRQIFANIAGADVGPLEVLKSFMTGFAGGFAAVILNIAKAFEVLTGALANLHLDFITKYFNDGATAAGALAGVIAGALIVGALTPGIGAFTGFGAAILDTAIKYGILGTAQLAFKAVAISLNAVAATLSATFAILGGIIELGIAAPLTGLVLVFGLVGIAIYKLWQNSERFRENIATIQENGRQLVDGFIAGFLAGLELVIKFVAALVLGISELVAKFAEFNSAGDIMYAVGMGVAIALGAIAAASIAASWEFWLIVAAVVGLIAVLNKLGVLDEIGTAMKIVFAGIVDGVQAAISAIEKLADYAGKLVDFINLEGTALELKITNDQIAETQGIIKNVVGGGVDKYVQDKMNNVENDPAMRAWYKQDQGRNPDDGDINKWVDSNADYFKQHFADQYAQDPGTKKRMAQLEPYQRELETLTAKKYRLENQTPESSKRPDAPVIDQSGNYVGGSAPQTITEAVGKANAGGLLPFLKDLIGGKMSPEQIMSTLGWDMPDVKAMTGISSMSNLSAADLFQPAIDAAQDEYIKRFYKAQTGAGLYRDIKGQWAVDTDKLPQNHVRDQMGIGVGFTDAMGGQGERVTVDPAALQTATDSATKTIEQLTAEQEKEAQNLEQLNAEIGNFAQSISNIDLAAALKGVYDSALKPGGVSAATTLNTYSDQIMSNLSTAMGGGELPWQNSFEMMMDAAGTGGGMGKNMNGKNLHKALKPYLQTFADQSGVDVNELMKGIPIFNAPEALKGMGQTDLMQWADNLAPDQYKKLDLLGTNPYAHANSSRAGEVFDAQGMDWTELMNFGTGQAAAGNADWNLTDYIMESWDLTRKQAEAYIKDNGLDPNVINGAMFEDTQLLAASQNGLVNVITPEWMDYLNKVTQDGTDKTIEITQEAFDKLPDVVKIGYSNMGYQFVIGGQENADQAAASTQMIMDQLGKQYPELAGMYDDLVKDLGTSDGKLGQYFEKESWTDEFGNKWVNLKDELTGQTITIPEVDYEAYLASVRETLKGQEELQAFLDKQKQQKIELDNINLAHGGTRQRNGEVTGFQPLEDGAGTTPAAPAFDWSSILPDQATIDAATAQTTTAISTSFDTAIQTMLPTIGESLNELYTEVINKFLEMNSVIITIIPYIGATLPTNLTDVILPEAQAAAFAINNAVTNEFVGLRNNVQNLTSDIGQSLVASISSQIGIAAAVSFQLGLAIAQGVASGIYAAMPAVHAAMAELVASTNVAGQKAGIIMSPSHLTRDDIGVHLGTGVAEGIEDAIPANQMAMQRLVSSSTDVNAGGGIPVAGNSGGGDVHYTIHIEHMHAATGEDFINQISDAVDRRLGEKQALQRRGMTAVAEKE